MHNDVQACKSFSMLLKGFYSSYFIRKIRNPFPYFDGSFKEDFLLRNKKEKSLEKVCEAIFYWKRDLEYWNVFNCIHSVWKSPKMSHFSISILAFSTNFCPFKIDLSGNTVWPQALDFQKFAKMHHFWPFFNEVLSIQNVGIARFARNVEWDFFCDFQTLCVLTHVFLFDLQNYSFCSRLN